MRGQRFNTMIILGIFILVSLPVKAVCRYTNEGGGVLTSGDLTVKDNVTGLIWQRAQAPNGASYTQAQGASYCSSTLNINGFTFRLPTVRELTSLVDYNRYNPSIDPVAFPNTTAGYFWSSTSYQPNSANAWLVYFFNGSLDDSDIGTSYYVRCVR